MNKADQAVTINNCLTKSENGIILVNKPQGVTSNEVVQTIRKNIGIKIGHCGTLDPLATGLLIACVGKGTKISNYIMSLEKEYLALIQLGEERDTDDEMGITIEKSDVQVTEKQIHDVLMQFEGDINQMPPQFSAIKVNGKRAYSVARKGETVSLTSRNVKIYDYQLISFQNQQITLRVVCSRGTYIRSLARDIGRKLGTYGYLKELKRLRIGKFKYNDVNSVQDYSNFSYDMLNDKLISIYQSLYFFPYLIVKENIEKKVFHGQQLSKMDFINSEILNDEINANYKLVDSNYKVLAIIDCNLKYLNVFHYEDL